MTLRQNNSPQPRRTTCARCGTAFKCGLGDTCWCAAEPYRLSASAQTAEDCLCPACLRAAAAAAGHGA
jgi:cysteine-rich CWC protein